MPLRIRLQCPSCRNKRSGQIEFLLEPPRDDASKWGGCCPGPDPGEAPIRMPRRRLEGPENSNSLDVATLRVFPNLSHNDFAQLILGSGLPFQHREFLFSCLYHGPQRRIIFPESATRILVGQTPILANGKRTVKTTSKGPEGHFPCALWTVPPRNGGPTRASFH